MEQFQVEALQARYDKVLKDPSDIVEHLPTLVKTVEELDAKKVIEVGVRYGVSTIAWLYALQNRGFLWAVDVSYPVPAPGSDVNLLDPQGGLTVLPHWLFLLGNGTSKQVLDALPKKVDIVFIDTNHVYSQTLVELELYYPRVRKGGRILLHDTAIEDTGNRGDEPKVSYPVRTAVEEFCEKYDLKWDNVTNCNGLGTIYC
jgi:cephalosporin hydroxylase